MHIVEVLLSSVTLIGLIMTWQHYNARWLFLILILVQSIEATVKPIAIQWTQHYYLWLLFANILYLLLLLTRSVLARRLHKASGLNFFKLAGENYSLTVPECAYYVLALVSMILCGAQWIEIQLYYYKILEYPFIYHHVWVPVMYALHVLQSLSLITYIFVIKRTQGTLQYENN
ncbi:hypothetical protein CWB99_17855 [Pseudoalteromonas rubra]|uniref:Uncharacterized protein n=1 Tax=Pseudoalteromonas rubra TaxID=43658 RepID=A0A5S3WIR4_9GAMM|nr:hypothetical protein [Pseudoalteromonas rubra]TMP26726.1 hypothetical protein CWB99_17855 [Pseudoalteromonas rubra]TMP30699.1 hypothetical protein CWC00_16085 [Pseudoalteromonas rubra]